MEDILADDELELKGPEDSGGCCGPDHGLLRHGEAARDPLFAGWIRGRIPPSGDPRWAQWTAPLQEFLTSARDWRALKAWGRNRGFSNMGVRHLIAWLTLNDLAIWSDRHKTWQCRTDPTFLG